MSRGALQDRQMDLYVSTTVEHVKTSANLLAHTCCRGVCEFDLGHVVTVSDLLGKNLSTSLGCLFGARGLMLRGLTYLEDWTLKENQ